jgi:hypothetical protein
MSNINSNSKNVRTQNPLDTAPAQRPQVGLNYGDRAKFQKVSQPLPPARPPVDQFKPKKDVDATPFASNAAYRSQRRQFIEGYKPRILDHVENGTAPRVGNKDGIPSDEAILNFLDRVISQPSKTAAVTAAVPAAKKATFIKA